MKLTAGGFQCGLGNLLGFQQAGFEIQSLIDNRKHTFAGKGTLKNFPGIQFYEKWSYLKNFNPTVLIASPSCSQVSMLGMKREDRGLLSNMPMAGFEFYLAMKQMFETRPDYIVVEYLKGILNHIEVRHDGLYRQVTNEAFEFPQEYRVQLIELNSQTYGVPQSRNRIFIFFSKKKFNFVYVPPSNPFKVKTVSDVLLELDQLREKGPLLNDEVPNHSEERKAGFNGLKFGESFYGGQNNKRLYPNKLAPTITSHCTQHVHPYEPRVLTVREVATFQGFPYDFEFCGSFSTQLDLVGRTVPPPMMKHFAQEIKLNMEHNYANSFSA